MRYYELEQHEPQRGDIVGLELGDTLIEAVISDVLEDGVVLELDEAAINLMQKANQQKLAEAPEPAMKWAQDIFAKDLAQPKTPEPAPAPEPAIQPVGTRREKTFKTMSDCENAIDWGVSTLDKLDPVIVSELIRAGNDTVVAYLKLIASRTNAYTDYDFEPEDFDHCQEYLSGAVENATVNSWVDILKTRSLYEAEYHGRNVPLGKPMAGDVKKSKVYVKGPKGNVVKVNFGDPNMRIKKSSPKHRKSFRARHHCENPGPRWKARYWSCRAW